MNKETDVLAIGGGVAGQNICMNKIFDPEVVGEWNVESMRGHIYDPDLPLKERNRPHMDAAVARGDLTIGDSIPEDRSFDIAYIGSPTGTHAAWLEQVLDMSDRPRIIVEKPVASGKAEEEYLARLLRRKDADPERIYVQEPYLLSEGARKVMSIIAVQQSQGNPPTDIRVRSTKNRIPDVKGGRSGDNPYYIEAPHTIALAGRFAGTELGSEHTRDGGNLYYQSIDENPLSEATYTEFEYNGAIVRVAQGLGPFVMSNVGKMTADPKPELRRDAEVHFASGHSLHLDLRPAVDSKARPYRHSVLTAYDPSGEQYNQELVYDYPIRTLFRQVLGELQDPTLPPLSGVGIMSSLVRCRALRSIADEAQVVSGVRL